MKILYDLQSKEVFYAVYDKDIALFEHTTNIPLDEMVVDEILNKELCIDLKNTEFKFDIVGKRKYYIYNGLNSVDNWKEYNTLVEII